MINQFLEDSNLSCENVRELLIKQKFERISERDWRAIDLHLQNCTACQNFFKAFELLPEVMHKFNESQAPSAQVKDRLLKEMRRKKQKAFSEKGRVLNRIHTFLNYRLPLYQLIAAVIIIVILNISVVKINQSLKREEVTTGKKETEPQRTVQQRQVSRAVLHLEIVNEKKGGKSLKQDSTYTRFVTFAL